MSKTPELPQPEVLAEHRFHWPEVSQITGFTADQMRAYAAEVSAADSYLLIKLLADIRYAAGDTVGRLDWPELVAHVAKLRADAGAASKLEHLFDKASAVVDRWDTPLWKDAPATGTYIYALRDALDFVRTPAAIDAAMAEQAEQKS